MGYVGAAILKPYNCEENLTHCNRHPDDIDVEDTMDLYMDWFYIKGTKKGGPPINKQGQLIEQPLPFD
jgi:hypothetical protein